MKDRNCNGALRAILLATMLGAAPHLLYAQVVVDPSVAEFEPSPDHDKLAPTGQSLVSRYDLAIYRLGESTAAVTLNLGKPGRDPDGKIRVNFRELLPSLPPEGPTYEAKIWAVGPGGRSGVSTSGPFVFGSGCSYAISPAASSVPAGGGAVALSVSAPTGCAWSASSSASWAVLTAGALGSGAGTVSLSIAPNGGASVRVATVTVAGQTVTITQAGSSCSYAVSPTVANFAPVGGNGSFQLSTASGCTWVLTSDAAWLTVSGATAGSGPATLNYSVAVNVGTSQRSATLSVGGATLRVVQAAQTCQYAFATPSLTMSAADSMASVAITAPTGCPWVAQSSAEWLTIVGFSSGTGAGTISFAALDNENGAARTALVSAGGATISVTQLGTSICSYATSPTSRVVGPGAASGAVTVTAGGENDETCVWTAASSADWLAISGARSGTGDGNLAYSIEANPTGLIRVGRISVAGRTLTVTQGAGACSYSVSTTTLSVDASASSEEFEVTAPAGCAWAVAKSASWLTLTSPVFSSGSGPVHLAVAANPLSTSRTGYVTVGGKTVTVMQAGNTGCTVDLSTDRAVLGKEPAEGTVFFSASPSCPLSVTSDMKWLSVVSVDAPSGTVRFAATRNDSGFTRSASLRIATRSFLVVQKSTGSPAAPGGLRVTGLGR